MTMRLFWVVDDTYAVFLRVDDDGEEYYFGTFALATLATTGIRRSDS
mgnify:CR=1 FL=1